MRCRRIEISFMVLTTRSGLIVLFSLVASMVLVGCDQSGDGAASPRQSTASPGDTRSAKAPSDMTPMDQSESSEHIEITAQIRRGIMNADDMSFNAKNCKIITDKTGTVTLRGAVDSQAEKDAVGAIARATTGVVSVNNLLEVQPG